MSLRVAEQPKGWLAAVDGCEECPFLRIDVDGLYLCNHGDGNSDVALYSDRIPVWCPLPTPTYSFIGVDKGVKAGDRTVKMRGLHPENIVWDEPPVFIVEDPGIEGFVMKEIIIKPEFPQGPDYACLRKDDCLTTGKDDYWICGTPTSSKIIITQGQDLKKGDRLVVRALARKETETLTGCPNLNDGKFHYLVEASIAGELKQYNKCCCGTEFYTDILKKKE